jgi:hypothetical protein
VVTARGEDLGRGRGDCDDVVLRLLVESVGLVGRQPRKWLQPDERFGLGEDCDRNLRKRRPRKHFRDAGVQVDAFGVGTAHRGHRHLVDGWIQAMIPIGGPSGAEHRGDRGAERVDEHHAAHLVCVQIVRRPRLPDGRTAIGQRGALDVAQGGGAVIGAHAVRRRQGGEDGLRGRVWRAGEPVDGLSKERENSPDRSSSDAQAATTAMVPSRATAVCSRGGSRLSPGNQGRGGAGNARTPQRGRRRRSCRAPRSCPPRRHRAPRAR